MEQAWDYMFKLEISVAVTPAFVNEEVTELWRTVEVLVERGVATSVIEVAVSDG